MYKYFVCTVMYRKFPSWQIKVQTKYNIHSWNIRDSVFSSEQCSLVSPPCPPHTHRSLGVVHALQSLQLPDVGVAEVAILGQLVARGARGGVEVSTDEVREEVAPTLGDQLLDGARHLGAQVDRQNMFPTFFTLKKERRKTKTLSLIPREVRTDLEN